MNLRLIINSHPAAAPAAPRGPLRALLQLALVLLAALVAPGAAEATPKPLPMSYFVGVKPAGHFELEQITDISPARVASETPNGTKAVTALRLDLTTEMEFGLGHGLEFGWYFLFNQAASSPGAAMAFSGVEQRIRWALAPEGEWPIDVGLYLEIAERRDEFEIEHKLLLSRRFGRVRAAINLWFEEEYLYATGEWRFIYRPTAGVTYDISPSAIVGLEYWALGHFGGREALPGEPVLADAVHYLGPTLMIASEGPWFALGAYLRLDNLSDDAIVGDQFGKLWFRAIIGYDL